VPLGEVVGAVVALQGPSTQHATTPDQVKLHDDKSTYTGVWLRVAWVARGLLRLWVTGLVMCC
jgi:hypothetical protein